MWYGREIKQMQSFMDKIYRHIWSRKTGPPLIQMQNEGKNRFDVRKDLGVASLRWKIEKRVLERIGHVMRMDDERITKVAVLGWLEALEGWEKRKGRRRKTSFYWKKLLKEAGIEWTDVGFLARDRKKWKKLVDDRMKHLKLWEEGRGKKSDGEMDERNKARVPQDSYMCALCGKVCISKSGLVNHRKRTHDEYRSKKKRTFECDRCKEVFKAEASMWNHRKVCNGQRATRENKKRCVCGKELLKKSLNKHLKICKGPVGATVDMPTDTPADTPTNAPLPRQHVRQPRKYTAQRPTATTAADF